MNSALTAFLSVSVVLGIMIFVHEWGHFIAAKLCGVRVEVFSFGFGTRLFGVKRGDTDYRVSALPFGGYVRMAGDNPVTERTGAPYEFLSQSRWKRVLIACAGPAMNILLAFLIFFGIYWMAGIPTAKYLAQPAVVAAAPQFIPNLTGIQAGDRINSVNGTPAPTWDKVFNLASDAKPGDTFKLSVSRNGADETLSASIPKTVEAASLIGYPPVPPVAEEIGIGYPAERAGMKAGDILVSIDGNAIVTWPQISEIVRHSEGRALNFVVRRNGQDISLSIAPMQGMDVDGKQIWQVGVVPRIRDNFDKQSFSQSVVDAASSTILGCRQIVGVLGGLFTGKVSVRELQGVVGIARESGRAAKRGPLDLVLLMAVISLNLGLLNLLPIPILDGGHILLLAIEGAMRSDLSIAFKERFVQVGLVFLLGIIGFVMYNDILKLIQSR